MQPLESEQKRAERIERIQHEKQGKIFCSDEPCFNYPHSELEAQQEKLRIMREKCEAKVVPKNVRNKIDKKFNKIKQRLKQKESQLKDIEEVSFFFYYKCNA